MGSGQRRGVASAAREGASPHTPLCAFCPELPWAAGVRVPVCHGTWSLARAQECGYHVKNGLLGAPGQGGKGCWHPAMGACGLLQINYKPEPLVWLLCCGAALVKCQAPRCGEISHAWFRLSSTCLRLPAQLACLQRGAGGATGSPRAEGKAISSQAN